MDRRRFLALLAGGLAGCGGREQVPGANRTTAPAPLDYESVTRSTPTPRSPPLDVAADATWPQFAADAANTGTTPDTAGPTERPGVAWRQWTLGEPVTNPVVAAGRLFVGTRPPGDDETGRIHAFDRATGAGLWTGSVPGPVTMPPAVADGRVHVVTGETLITFGLDGTRQYQQSIPPVEPTSAPTVADGRVFLLSAADREAVAIDAVTGDLAWTRSVPTPLTTPAVADGVVYLAAEQERVLALDADTREQLWEFSTGTYQPIQAAPAVGPDHVVVGLAHGPTTLVLDRATGERIWAAETGAWPTSSPAIADGTVVTADEDGTVVAYDLADGTERWRVSTAPVRTSPPTVADGVVYVASTREDDQGRTVGRVDAVSLSDGTGLWTREFESRPGGSVVAMDGLAYLALASKQVVCLQ